MEEKELFKLFNGVTYSEEEISEYLELGDMSNEELGIISGAVRTEIGRKNIAEGNNIVKRQLEDEEQVKSIIKIRNIKVLNALTVSSFFGMTTLGAGLDYGVFDTMYFTDTRVFFVDSNVANKPLMDRNKDLDEIVGIRFTNKVVRLIKDEEGELKIKLCRNKFKILSIIYPIIMFLLFLVIKALDINIEDIPLMSMGVFISIPLAIWAVTKVIQDMFLDRIQIAFKDGYVWDILIASNHYKQCRDFLEKLSKRYEVD
ncbi:hypothetical protein [Clostridium sp. LP20]|uniref:hypothetical protein n=1 Tax=Clostridium sp. LP20 TaxID=3418665 RepID=UPI003EE45327